MAELSKRSTLEKITPYTPGKPIEEVKRELGIEKVTKMASNENPLGPSPRAMEALREHLPSINIYPDGNAYNLKQGLMEYLDVKDTNILVGNGADELITLAAKTYLNPGDEIIMAQPSFGQYQFAALVMDAEPKGVVTKDYRHDLPAMLDAVTDKTRMIFICNPNNPTGTIVTHQELEDFFSRLPEGILVVIDEAYYEFATDPSYPRTLEFLKNGHDILILRTFSKIYGLAGLRIGYGLSKEKIVNDINTVRQPFNANAAGQIAAAAALQDKEYVEKVRRVNEEGKKYLEEELEKMGLFFLPTQANFMFIDMGVDSRDLFQRMLRKGVIVRTGDIFGYPNFIRLTIGTQEQNQRFIEALKETYAEMENK